MTSPGDLLGIYLHLARASAARRRHEVRDKFLVLAGVLAARLAIPRIADACRTEVLAHNPHHLVRHWSDFSSAAEDPDFLSYLRQLHRQYPLEKAERLLESLGIEWAGERAAYYSDEEYAAALLGLRK